MTPTNHRSVFIFDRVIPLCYLQALKQAPLWHVCAPLWAVVGIYREKSALLQHRPLLAGSEGVGEGESSRRTVRLLTAARCRVQELLPMPQAQARTGISCRPIKPPPKSSWATFDGKRRKSSESVCFTRKRTSYRITEFIPHFLEQSEWWYNCRRCPCYPPQHTISSLLRAIPSVPLGRLRMSRSDHWLRRGRP